MTKTFENITPPSCGVPDDLPEASFWRTVWYATFCSKGGVAYGVNIICAPRKEKNLKPVNFLSYFDKDLNKIFLYPVKNLVRFARFLPSTHYRFSLTILPPLRNGNVLRWTRDKRQNHLEERGGSTIKFHGCKFSVIASRGVLSGPDASHWQ